MVFRCCTIIMATDHPTAPRISDCMHCAFDHEEFWEDCEFENEEFWKDWVPESLVSSALIRELIENYNVDKFDSYCNLIKDIETIRSTNSRREEYLIPIVNTIKDFLLIPRNADDSLLLVRNEDMVAGEGVPSSRFERRFERRGPKQVEKKSRQNQSKRSVRQNQSKHSSSAQQTREELRALGDDKWDAKMRDKSRLRHTKQYEQYLHKHEQSPYYSDDAYEMSDSLNNPYVIKF